MISSVEQNYFRISEDRKTREHLRGCASTASNCFALVNCESRFSLPFRTATQHPSSLVQMFANHVLLPLLLVLSPLKVFNIYNFFCTIFYAFDISCQEIQCHIFDKYILCQTCSVQEKMYLLYYEKISSVISYFVSICDSVNRCKSS